MNRTDSRAMELDQDATVSAVCSQDSASILSSNSRPTPNASSVPVASPSPSTPQSQSTRNATTTSRVTSSRSRRGCTTCRKRKVKCDEQHPNCGHCVRLNLACKYEPPASPARGGKQKLGRLEGLRKESTTSQQRTSPTWPDNFEQQSSAAGAHHVVNTSRAQSIGYDANTMQDYNASMTENTMPGINSDLQMSDQVVQRLSGPDAWELELLGEDSLWTNLPILSNFMSVQDSEPYEYVSTYNVPPSPKPSMAFNNENHTVITSNRNENANTISLHLTQHMAQQNSFIQMDEITLLRHFVDFAVPPILVGVEPRWNSSRDSLLRLSKTHLPLRHAICAFSALSLGESPGNMPFAISQSSTYYANLAMNELQKLLDEQSSSDSPMSSYEGILASIFFLSYIELIVSNTPKSSLELLSRAHTLMSSRETPNSVLYHQLQIWLKLLDAKVVSAGGEGVHLHTNPETRDLEAVRESYSSSLANDEQTGPAGLDVSILETEEILFNSLNRQAYNFYVQVLNFSGRIARLDKWHRSRGSVQDELEVMLAADKISRDLNALWTRRPAIIDLADRREHLRQYMSGGLAIKVEQHLRTYTANFYACFIHLQRVAYAHLRATPQVKSAVLKIVHLTRLATEDASALPASMLWPLMMAACEAEDEETQTWIIGNIEGMSSKVGNAMRTAGLVKEIVKRQKGGQRADARTVMQETFGQVFAII